MQHGLRRWAGRSGLILISALGFGLNSQAADYYISMEPYGFLQWRFNPNYLEIQVGDTVTWINEDYSYYDYHDATCYAGSYILWSTGSVDVGYQSDPITFPYVATYNYVDHSYYQYGMTGTLVVKAATTQPPVPATLIAPQVLADGRFQCTVSNLVVGRTNIIQATTNLSATPVVWTTVSSNIVSSSVQTFTDNNAAVFRIRFYRACEL